MSVAWQEVRIGDVFKTGAGGTPLKSRKEFYENGEVPWLLSGEISKRDIKHAKNCITPIGLDNSSAKIFPKDSVLVAMYGATAGQVGILRINAATNQAVCAIYPSDEVLPEYLYYALLSKNQELVSKAAGNAQPNISQSKIKNTKIPLPSIFEQKRIVAILDEAFTGIDAAIANTEKNLSNARELFESYSQSVFEEERNGWKPTSLGGQIDLLAGFAFKSKGYTQDPQSLPLLRGDNIVQDSLRWEKVKRWPESDVRTYEKYLLAEGDAVLAMDRTWVNAGIKFAKIEKRDLPCLLVQRVARLRAREGLEPEFLRFLIGSKSFERYVLSIQTGLGVPHISGKQIENFRFYLPPMEDQTQIVSRFNVLNAGIRNLETLYAHKLAALSELKQSLLKRAFEGKLTANLLNGAAA